MTLTKVLLRHIGHGPNQLVLVPTHRLQVLDTGLKDDVLVINIMERKPVQQNLLHCFPFH